MRLADWRLSSGFAGLGILEGCQSSATFPGWREIRDHDPGVSLRSTPGYSLASFRLAPRYASSLTKAIFGRLRVQGLPVAEACAKPAGLR